MKLYFDVNSELESRYEQMSILFLNELDITKKNVMQNSKHAKQLLPFTNFFMWKKACQGFFFKHFQEDFL